MEVILSIAFGLQTDFQTKGDKTITSEAMDWFHIRTPNLFIGLSLRLIFLSTRISSLMSSH